MKTVALRFGEHFSPACGTIAAHEEVIESNGYVWYGKMGGAALSRSIIETIMSSKSPRILLIRSGKAERYWAETKKIQYETPEISAIPAYYRDKVESFKTWFKVKQFVSAEKDIMSKCKVASSGKILRDASKHSMSHYFIIEYSG